MHALVQYTFYSSSDKNFKYVHKNANNVAILRVE